MCSSSVSFAKKLNIAWWLRSNCEPGQHLDSLLQGSARDTLRQGIGKSVVDVVTERQANLHRELSALLELNGREFDSDLYTVSYAMLGVSHFLR